MGGGGGELQSMQFGRGRILNPHRPRQLSLSVPVFQWWGDLAGFIICSMFVCFTRRSKTLGIEVHPPPFPSIPVSMRTCNNAPLLFPFLNLPSQERALYTLLRQAPVPSPRGGWREFALLAELGFIKTQPHPAFVFALLSHWARAPFERISS